MDIDGYVWVWMGMEGYGAVVHTVAHISGEEAEQQFSEASAACEREGDGVNVPAKHDDEATAKPCPCSHNCALHCSNRHCRPALGSEFEVTLRQ